MKSRKIISITLALITALFAVMSCIPTALAAEYQANGATYFTFTDGGIIASEGTYDGYKIEGTSLTINDSGTYVLSGSCAGSGHSDIPACLCENFADASTHGTSADNANFHFVFLLL